MYFVDLGDNTLDRHGLCDLTMEGATLPRVREVFGFNDLEFPILIDKREDHKRVVVNRSAIIGGERDCELRHGYVLRSETT